MLYFRYVVMEMGEILNSFFINSEEVTYKTKHNNTKKNKENNTHKCRQRLPEFWHKVMQLKSRGRGPHDNSSTWYQRHCHCLPCQGAKQILGL